MLRGPLLWGVLSLGGLVMALGAWFVLWLWITVDAFDLADLVFYLIAASTVGFGAYSVATRNIVRSVFSLLGCFFGVACLYATLAADFLAVVQLMVYVGGILVLMLFAVMLTSRIEVAQKSNLSSGFLGKAGATFVGLALFSMLGLVAILTPWPHTTAGEFEPTVDAMGNSLLEEGLLPFELLSVVLLAVVIGAVVIVRSPAKSSRAEENEAGQ
jgi:NADH-quinone oxidoreductase subunit J